MVKFDKILDKLRDGDDPSRVFSSVSEMNTYQGSFDGEVVFVLPNSAYAWSVAYSTWILITNRNFVNVAAMNAETGTTGELAIVLSPLSLYVRTGAAWTAATSAESDPVFSAWLIATPPLYSISGQDHSLLTNLDYDSSGHTGFLGVKSRTGLATTWSTAPTLYDTQATYKVYEYTYGTTKYYRRVYNTYSPATDIFYGESGLTTVIATRALSI